MPSPPCNKVIFNASLSLKHVLLAHQPCRQGPFCQLKLQTGRHFIMESFLIEKDQNSLLSKKVLGLDSCVNKGWVRQIGYFSWSATEEMAFCYKNCSDLLWEKIILVIEKISWNSRLKAENLQNCWDHWNNSFKQWIG